jgi:regulator of RNase E activity RraB
MGQYPNAEHSEEDYLARFCQESSRDTIAALLVDRFKPAALYQIQSDIVGADLFKDHYHEVADAEVKTLEVRGREYVALYGWFCN